MPIRPGPGGVGSRRAVLLVGHGAPSRPEDARPYLVGILGEPDRPGMERWVQELVDRYRAMGGSAYNALMEDQAGRLHRELVARRFAAPVVCGMRYWSPRIGDVISDLESGGVDRITVVILSLPRCGRSWDHYADAVRSSARRVALDFVTDWWEDPSFVRASGALLHETLASVPGGPESRAILFSAHSVPVGSCPACRSGERTCSYEQQMEEIASRVAAAACLEEAYRLCYQGRSRSAGSWCGPSLTDAVSGSLEEGVREVVVHPVGFLTDHVEIRYDLDVRLARLCEEAGSRLHRAPTIGSHPLFIHALADRIEAVGS